MSQSAVITERHEVASRLEIVVTALLFAFVLYLLYPKEMLRQQILNEKSNYTLTMMYLKNMLRLEPENTELMVAMVVSSTQQGSLDLAEELLGVLRDRNDASLRQTLDELTYWLLKKQNQYEEDEERVFRKEQEMRMILQRLSIWYEFTKEDRLMWYNEAIAMSEKESALRLLAVLYRDNDPFALEQCVYLAGELGQQKIQTQCHEGLSQLEAVDRREWLITAYTLYTASKDEAKRVKVLAELAQLDTAYQEEYAKVVELQGDFKRSGEIYLKLFQNSYDTGMRKRYLLRAVSAFAHAGETESAEQLAVTHEALYLNDYEMVESLIKLYLATEKLEAARRLSLKLLERY